MDLGSDSEGQVFVNENVVIRDETPEGIAWEQEEAEDAAARYFYGSGGEPTVIRTRTVAARPSLVHVVTMPAETMMRDNIAPGSRGLLCHSGRGARSGMVPMPKGHGWCKRRIKQFIAPALANDRCSEALWTVQIGRKPEGMGYEKSILVRNPDTGNWEAWYSPLVFSDRGMCCQLHKQMHMGDLYDFELLYGNTLVHKMNNYRPLNELCLSEATRKRLRNRLHNRARCPSVISLCEN
jgi:hypothetical protein